MTQGVLSDDTRGVITVSTKNLHAPRQWLLAAGSMSSQAEPGHMAANRLVAACLWGNHHLAVSGLARVAAKVCHHVLLLCMLMPHAACALSCDILKLISQEYWPNLLGVFL